MKEKHNFFKILGMPEIYNIDIDQLNANYLKQQIKCHPDQFANKTKAEKDSAEYNSSLINQAYGVIKHPITRAEYILHLKGLDITESDNQIPPSLLQEAMTWRENLEEAHSQDSIKDLNNAIEGLYNDHMQELDSLLGRGLYQDAFNVLINIKFVIKLLDYAKQKLKN